MSYWHFSTFVYCSSNRYSIRNRLCDHLTCGAVDMYSQTDLDCVLTSRRLCQLVDDKVWMRVLISDKCHRSVVQVPRTLAFVCRPVESYDRRSSNVGGAATATNGADVKQANGHDSVNEHIMIVSMTSTNDDVAELMRSSVSTFVNSLRLQRCSRVCSSSFKLPSKDDGFPSFQRKEFVEI